jgi:hypothetical protein
MQVETMIFLLQALQLVTNTQSLRKNRIRRKGQLAFPEFFFPYLSLFFLLLSSIY